MWELSYYVFILICVQLSVSVKGHQGWPLRLHWVGELASGPRQQLQSFLPKRYVFPTKIPQFFLALSQFVLILNKHLSMAGKLK